MRRIPTRPTPARLAVAGLATMALLGLSACGGDDGDAEASDSTAETPAATESEPTEEPTEEPTDTEAPAGGDQPEWAEPVTTPGEKITTIEAGDITVDVYQVGVTKATKDGMFADPDTNEPLIAKGDEIVFVNYVATNNGDDIDLGSSGVSVSARYDDWPWAQGMDSIVDLELYEEHDVNDDAFAADAYRDPSVYTFGSGQQISWGENFIYQAGSPITFDVSVIPVDADGELLHDEKVEAEGAAEIQ